MENKTVNDFEKIPGLIVGALLSIAFLFAAGGVAILAIKWFVSLIKGGL
jgi:hypothetical protein